MSGLLLFVVVVGLIFILGHLFGKEEREKKEGFFNKIASKMGFKDI